MIHTDVRIHCMIPSFWDWDSDNKCWCRTHMLLVLSRLTTWIRMVFRTIFRRTIDVATFANANKKMVPCFLSTVQFVFAPNKKQHNIFVCYLIEVLTTSICIVRGNYTVNENFEWFYVWSIYSQILIIRTLKLNNVFKCLDIAFCILYNFNYDS